MEVLHPRSAGLDVHKDSVVACVRCVSPPQSHQVRTFATTTSDLLALADWLEAHGCTHVAMEATGVYWKPVWHLLEGRFALVLANAQHIRNVPGRKTDLSATGRRQRCNVDRRVVGPRPDPWQFRAPGPDPGTARPVCRQAGLTRTRKQLVREISQHTLRLQKVLEDANIKVASVLSNILGQSGRAMLTALIAGQQDPEHLADLACGTARRKRPELIEALRRAYRQAGGQVTPHHRALLQLHLDIISALETAVAKVEAAMGTTLAPIAAAADLLKTMPGVSDVVAHVLLAETCLPTGRSASTCLASQLPAT